LHRLAANLGADVPFFLRPQPAVGRGIGEDLAPILCGTAVPLVLINLGFPVPVSWAYTKADTMTRPAPPALDDLIQALETGPLEAIAPLTYNALEYGLIDKFPILEMLIEFLLSQGCLTAHVSGSGPTVYGICQPDAGERIAEAAHREFGDAAWICTTTTIPTT